MLFLPVRPSLSVQASWPKLTPMTAAHMSPRIRKSTDAIAMLGGEMAIVSVHPRLNELPPVICFCSCSRSSWRIGQLRRTTSTFSRRASAHTPVIVIAQHSRTHEALLKPLLSMSWWMSGTSRPARWKVLRSISRTARATFLTETPAEASRFFGLCALL